MLDQGVSAVLVTFLSAPLKLLESVLWVMDNMAQDHTIARKQLLEDGILVELFEVSFKVEIPHLTIIMFCRFSREKIIIVHLQKVSSSRQQIF